MEEYSRADARAYIADKFERQGDFNILPKDVFERMLDKVMDLDEAFMAQSGVNEGAVYDDDQAFDYMMKQLQEAFPEQKMYAMRFVEDYMEYDEAYLEICKYNTGLDVVYFGDTARVPYGSRTVETITRYAEQDVRFLLSQGVEAILIACGTVSTNCLPALTKSFSLPIVGVIDAGCQAALRSSRTKRIGVIGTRATINSRAYEHRIRELCPDAQTWGVECPLFVPLIENGFAPDDPITELTVDRYLSQFKGAGVDTIIMGCTHYPFLAKTLQNHMPDVSFINVGKALSYGLKEQFDLPRTQTPNRVSYFVSDEDTGFLDIARRYLDAVQADNVQKVNIDQF